MTRIGNGNPNAQYLVPGEAAAYIGCSERSLVRWRMEGTGPEYRRAGKRKVLYRVSDIIAWLDARAFRSTSAEPPANRAA